MPKNTEPIYRLRYSSMKNIQHNVSNYRETSTRTLVAATCNVKRSDMHTHTTLQTVAEHYTGIQVLRELKIFSINRASSIVKYANYSIAIQLDYDCNVTAYVNYKPYRYCSKYLNKHIFELTLGPRRFYELYFLLITYLLYTPMSLYRIKHRFRTTILGDFHVDHYLCSINNTRNERYQIPCEWVQAALISIQQTYKTKLYGEELCCPANWMSNGRS